MNKHIRNGLAGIAIAGGTVLGAVQVGGIANAQVDDTDTTVEQTDGTETDADDRADRRAQRRSMRTAAREAVADVIGIDSEVLENRLRDGDTLGDIAAEHGVETSAVADVIVDQFTERIETAVADGRVAQERVDEKLAGLDERVTTFIEEGRPERRDGEGRHGRGDRHGGNPAGDADVATDGEG